MSLAPNWKRPVNVSPFTNLPIVYRCRACDEPITDLERCQIIWNNILVHGLCWSCAKPTTD